MYLFVYKTNIYKLVILFFFMVFKKEEGYNISELGNWNVANDYSKTKIMKPLDYCDHYENIARFGYDTLLDQLENFGVPQDNLKLIGFERLVNELIKLCGNCKFAMKVKGTKDELIKLEKKLIKIRSLMKLFSKTITKNRTKQLKLNEERYYTALDFVLEIKSKLNEPLNKNHLIFTDKPEFDPKAYKSSLMEDAKTRG